MRCLTRGVAGITGTRPFAHTYYPSLRSCVIIIPMPSTRSAKSCWRRSQHTHSAELSQVWGGTAQVWGGKALSQVPE